MSVSPALVCPVCHDVFSQPMILNPCSHTFCQNCIASLLTNQCPLCRSEIADYRLNLALNSLIGEILVPCKMDNFGCEYRGLPDDLISHSSKCVYEKLRKYIENTESRILSLETLVKVMLYIITLGTTFSNPKIISKPRKKS